MLLIADDWSRIAGCYGNPVIQTPRIDALAQQGIVFDWAFCTSPSCAVSRACILTGQHSHTHGQYGHCHGVHGFRTHEHMTSIPQVLRGHGFATACIGKKHVAPNRVYPFEYEPPLQFMGPAGAGGSLLEMAAAARTFFNENRRRPFYMHVGFHEPHRHGRAFGEGYVGIPEVYYDPANVLVPPFLPDIPAVRQELAQYYRAISRFDYGVGLMLDALTESGRADETLVILMTDHGMPFPGAKASFFDTGHHCPLLIATPTLSQRGTRNQALVSWVDIRPTVHEWCGVEQPAELPGRSFLPILEHPAPDGWDTVYFSHCFHEVMDYNPYRVVRGRRYKYVRNLAAALTPPLPSDMFRSVSWAAVREDQLTAMGVRSTSHVLQRAPEELYDLETDPWETTNHIADPALQDVAHSLRQHLYTFRRATSDPWLEVDVQEGRIASIDN
jgi:N-sulfoglucosamine sulfohydrolase